jgi:O-antigen/teichoic acid export membrane protein
MTHLPRNLFSRGLGLLKGRTTRGAIGSFALRVGSTVLGFITGILLARLLGAKGYGIYTYAFAWTNLLIIPATLGLNRLLVREVATYNTQAAWGRIRALLRWSNGMVALLSVAIAVAAAAVFWKALGGNATSYALVIALASLPFTTLTTLRQGALRGLRHIVTGQLPEMLLRPLLLIALVLGAYALLGRLNALWVVALAVLAIGISFAVGAWLLQRALPPGIRHAQPEYSVRKWLGSAFPFMFIGGMLVINSYTDVIMLGILRDQASVGVYSIVVRVATLTTFVIAAADAALAPSLANLFVTGNLKRLEFVVRRSTFLVMLFTLPITLAIIVFGKPILSVFGQDFTQGFTALVILSLGQFANVATGTVGTLLSMTGHERDTATAVAVSAALNIVLNAILIPRWGLVGAGTATACSIVVQNVLLARFVYRRLGFYSMLGIVNFRRAT